MERTSDSQPQVSPIVGLAYALPMMSVTILLSTNNVLSGLYATHYGLALSAIATVMLIAGLFDAVTDPSIGYFSDRYHARTGSRRPFVVAGAVLLIPSAWFLLNPGEGVTVTYFLVWYLLFYLAFTLFNIPHLTWGGEISPYSEQKSKIYAYRNYAGYAGTIIFTLIPILPFYEGTKITPETMRYLVLVAGVLLLPTLYLLLRHAPTGVHRPDQSRTPENPFTALMALIHNPPALWYIGAAVLHALAGAFYIGLKFMMMESYLGMGQYYVHLLLFLLVTASLAIKPAVWLIARIGKVRAWMLGNTVSIAASLILMLVLLNNAYSLALFVAFNAVYALASAIGNVVAFSLLSDISDYGTLKSGVDRSATYFSLSSLSQKTCMALGIAASIAIAGWYGFDPKAETQVPEVYWGLTLCMCIIPILCNLGAVYCASKTAINTRRHDVIRRRLDSRVARAAAKHSAASDKSTSDLRLART